MIKVEEETRRKKKKERETKGGKKKWHVVQKKKDNLRVPSNLVAMVSKKLFWGARRPLRGMRAAGLPGTGSCHSSTSGTSQWAHLPIEIKAWKRYLDRKHSTFWEKIQKSEKCLNKFTQFRNCFIFSKFLSKDMQSLLYKINWKWESC